MEKVDDYEFAIGDTFLCYHGPLLYVAKCLDKETTSDGKIEYYIHYKGWNSRWEEWVDTKRILPINDENMFKMESLKQIYSTKNKNKNKRTSIKVKKSKQLNISSKSTQCANVSFSNTPKPNKKGDRVPITVNTDKLLLDRVKSINKAVEEVDEGTEIVKVTNSVVATKTIENSITDSIASKSKHVIYIPSVLKRKMVYDCLMIKKYNKMVKFQKSNTVEKLINDYFSSKSTFCERSLSIGLTLIQYFNVKINTDLLYTEERENNIHEKAIECLRARLESGEIRTINHGKILYPKTLYHYIYAPIYLLRLFVNLMEWIPNYHEYTDDQLIIIVSCIEDFLKYVENNHEQYFSENDYN